MRGLTRHMHAHAVQIDCDAYSIRVIDQIRPETVVSGPWRPARRRSPPGQHAQNGVRVRAFSLGRPQDGRWG